MPSGHITIIVCVGIQKKSKVWSVILRASKVIKIAQHEKTRHKYFLHGYWYWQGLKLLIKINTKELKMACNDTIYKLLKLSILHKVFGVI